MTLFLHIQLKLTENRNKMTQDVVINETAGSRTSL